MNRMQQLKHFDAIVKRTEALRYFKESLLLLNSACNQLEAIQGDADYLIRDNLGFDIEDKIEELEVILKESYQFNVQKQSQLHPNK